MRMEQGRPKKGVETFPQDTGKARDKAGASVGVSGAARKAWEAEQAKLRLKTNDGGKRGLPKEMLPEAGQSRDKAGASVGVSGKSVDKAVAILEAAPDIAAKVSAGHPGELSTGFSATTEIENY